MSLTGAFPIERSSLYQFHLIEAAAVSVHKWHLSERACRDVGQEYADWNWVMAGHRERWVSGLKERGEYPLR